MAQFIYQYNAEMKIKYFCKSKNDKKLNDIKADIISRVKAQHHKKTLRVSSIRLEKKQNNIYYINFGRVSKNLDRFLRKEALVEIPT